MKLVDLLSKIPVPLAYDAQTKQVSFRLWAVSLSFHMAALSTIALHFWSVSIATWTSITFFALCMVFYMLKGLTKAKIDLDDRSIELDDNTDQKPPPS